MSSGSGTDRDLAERLLDLPDSERRTDFLREEGLLDAGGLDRLLEVAEEFLGDDPGKARRLAEFCADTAEIADAPAAVPRASYIRAGAHNANGEFEEDLHLTADAYDGYIALGMKLEALRTYVGRMPALIELGRYEKALGAGQYVLDALADAREFDAPPSGRESTLLAALVYQNFGACYEIMGHYDEALDAYSNAEERYRDLDMTESLGAISTNRGLVLSQLGRGNEALAAHEVATDIFRKEGLTLLLATSLSNVGEAHLQLANYARSLDAFEQARRLLDSLDALADKHFLLRSTADAYLSLNLYPEALTAYREANGLLRSAGMTQDRARALWGMGSALIAQSRLEEAEGALNEAADLFEQAGNAPLLSGVMLEQASVLATRGDRSTALATAKRALELVSGDERLVQLVYAHLRVADLLMPNVAEAEPHLRKVQRLSEHLALPQLRYRLNERLGHLRLLQGRDEEARTLLEAATEEVERLRGAVAQDSMRASFLRDKTAAYEDLLTLHLTRDTDEDVRRAFTVAERAKSRALVDLLTGVANKESKASTDTVQDTYLSTLQADLNAVYNQLLGSPSDDGRRVPLTELQARAAELEGEIGRLRLHAAAAGSTSELFAASMPLEVIQDVLTKDVPLLSYHIVGGEVVAFVNVDSRIRAVRRLSTVARIDKLTRRLAAQWNRFRMGRGFAERNMAMLKRSTKQILAALYDELVASLELVLEEASSRAPSVGSPARKLAIVPHGLLHQVPFHALFDGNRYLIERFEISYAPSATVYALCQRQEARERNRALVIGVEDPSIPAAAAEAHAVAENLPGARVRVGEAATVEALREEAPDHGTLHFACHGLFRADNPMFSALKLHDGWLTAADAVMLDLTGALVTLSACESGRAEVIGGDEIIGLTRAFLGAGAATLVVSLWLVQDETTAELMGRFYELISGGASRAAALRAAQLEMKERHPHPYYWAPFVLIGGR